MERHLVTDVLWDIVDVGAVALRDDDVRLPFPPAWIQKLGLIAGAPTGRVLGYRPAYVPAEATDVSLAI